MKKGSLFVSAVTAGFIFSLMVAFKAEAKVKPEIEEMCYDRSIAGSSILKAKHAGLSREEVYAIFTGNGLMNFKGRVDVIYDNHLEFLSPSLFEKAIYTDCINRYKQ